MCRLHLMIFPTSYLHINTVRPSCKPCIGASLIWLSQVNSKTASVAVNYIANMSLMSLISISSNVSIEAIAITINGYDLLDIKRSLNQID